MKIFKHGLLFSLEVYSVIRLTITSQGYHLYSDMPVQTKRWNYKEKWVM